MTPVNNSDKERINFVYTMQNISAQTNRGYQWKHLIVTNKGTLENVNIFRYGWQKIREIFDKKCTDRTSAQALHDCAVSMIKSGKEAGYIDDTLEKTINDVAQRLDISPKELPSLKLDGTIKYERKDLSAPLALTLHSDFIGDSSYLQAALKSGMKETYNQTVTLLEIPPTWVGKINNFYVDRDPSKLPLEDPLEFLRIVDFLQAPELKEVYVNHLIKNEDIDNYLLLFPYTHDLPEQNEKLERYINGWVNEGFNSDIEREVSPLNGLGSHRLKILKEQNIQLKNYQIPHHANDLVCEVISSHFTDLKKISFKNCKNITDIALYFDKFTQLEELDLSYTNITDNIGIHFDKLSQLKKLDLTFTNITDNIGSHFGKLPELQSLNLSSTKITDNIGTHFDKLSQLEALSLTSTKITDNIGTHFDKLSQLEALNLSSTKITDNIGTHFQKLPNLKALSLTYNRKITDNIGRFFTRMGKLEILKLSDTSITMKILTQFDKLIQLEELDLSYTDIAYNAYNHVPEKIINFLFKNLQRLEVINVTSSLGGWFYSRHH